MLTFPKNFEHAVDFLCVDEENPWQHTDSIGYYATLRSCHMSLVPTGKVLNLARHRPGLVVVDVTCMERKSLHASGVTSVNCVRVYPESLCSTLPAHTHIFPCAPDICHPCSE